MIVKSCVFFFLFISCCNHANKGMELAPYFVWVSYTCAIFSYAHICERKKCHLSQSSLARGEDNCNNNSINQSKFLDKREGWRHLVIRE